MRLGFYRGIEIRINPAFLGLCLIYAWLGISEVLWAILALIFHEAGHMLAAVWCGLELSKVELFPLGGEISTEGLVGDQPYKEITVALAGPLVSLFLAGLTYIMERNLGISELSFFVQFSLILGVFNLWPALPLDGGRILRALLSKEIGVRSATILSSWSGYVLAGILLLLGVYWGHSIPEAWCLPIIGGFLAMKVRSELRTIPYSFTRYLVRKRLCLNENKVIRSSVVVVPPTMKVGRILNCSRPDCLMLVVVIDSQGQIMNVLTEKVLIEEWLIRDPMTTIAELLSDPEELIIK